MEQNRIKVVENVVNNLMNNNDFVAVEFLLEYLDVSTLPAPIMITITNIVKHRADKLNNYHYWYEKCMKEFADRGYDTSKLLTKDN